MPITVDPKNGTDVVQTDFALPIGSAWSWYGWLRRASTTGGQPMSMGSGHLAEVYWSGSTTDRLTIDRVTSGTKGQWQVTAANDRITYSATSWVFLAVTQSGISAPVVYTAQPDAAVDLGTCTVTVGTTPTGTESTGTGQRYYIGNWSGLDYALGGETAWQGFHNVALTAGEIREAYHRGFTLRGAVLLTTLESTSKLFDLSGNAYALTNSGCADFAGKDAPVHPIWRRSGAGIVVPASSGVVYPTSAAVTASSTVTAAPARRRGVVAAVASVSTVAALPSRRRGVTPAVAASSTVTAAAGAHRIVTPAIGASSNVAAVARKANEYAAAEVTAVSTVQAVVSLRRGVVAGVAAVSTVSVSTVRYRTVQAGVAASSTVAASTNRRRPVVASCAITSDVQALPSKFDRIAAGVDASSTVAVSPGRKRAAAAGVACASSVAAAPARSRGVQAHVQSSTTVTVTPTAPTVTVSTVAAGVYP